MKVSIGTRIALGYALAIISILVVGLVTRSGINKLLDSATWVEHTHLVINKIDAVALDVIKIQTGHRGYAIVREEVRLKPYNQGITSLEKDLNELGELIKDSSEQTERFRLLRDVANERADHSRQVVAALRSGDAASARTLMASDAAQAISDNVSKYITEMKNHENQKLKERKEDSEASARFVMTVALLGAAGVPFLLFVIGIFIVRSISEPLSRLTVVADKISQGDLSVAVSESRRGDEIGVLTNAFTRMIHSLQQIARAAERVAAGDLNTAITPQSRDDVVSNALISMGGNLSSLVGQVQRSGIQVNSSATEIAATAKQQQATTSQISSTTAEIGSTSKEIAATSRELANSMREVAQATEETTALATNSQSGLSRMENTIRQIMEASGSINSRLAILSDKAGNINAVVTTITKVADQTNLLSLNAAIEAEKAGEYGRGFAVVATEIRRLADQTAGATYEVEQIVKEMQSAVSASVMGMDKFSEEVRRGVEEVKVVSEQLGQIIQQVQIMKPSFESVNEGMQAQSIGAQQISDALLQLGEAAQQTAESLRQSNTAIEQLNEASRGLQSSVSRFKLRG